MMKINYKYTEDNLLLHPSSEDLFYYFNYNSINDFRYRNIQNLVDLINDLEKYLSIEKDVLVDKKVLRLNLEDYKQYNSFHIFYFKKEEIDDLLEDLVLISYHENRKLFHFLKKEVRRKIHILNLFDK